MQFLVDDMTGIYWVFYFAKIPVVDFVRNCFDSSVEGLPIAVVFDSKG
jgi:hypothetical protein